MKYLGLNLVLFFAISCTTGPSKRQAMPSPPQAVEATKKAEKFYNEQKYDKAIETVNQVIQAYPDTETSLDAYILKAKIYESFGQNNVALDNYYKVIHSAYYSKKDSTARLRAARILIKQNKRNEAAPLIESVLSNAKDHSKIKTTALKLKIVILEYQERYRELLVSLVGLSENVSNASQKEAYKLKALDITETKLRSDDLMYIASNRQYSFLRATALFRLGTSFFEDGDLDRAESYLNGVMQMDKEGALTERAAVLLKQIHSRSKVKPYTIGVILPLSGRHAKNGYRSLRGIQMALGVFDKKRSRFRIAIMDSEGDPNIARRAVEKLVIEDNAIAIIGSLLSRTSIEVAKKSQELGVPSIALSQKAGVNDIGEYIFRNALTSEMQVRELVRAAMEDKKLTRFAILYPNDSYGIEFSNLFWDEVLASGGEIVGAQTYEPSEKDFYDSVRRLVGTYYREDRFDEYRLRQNEWKEKNKFNTRKTPPKDLLPPIVDFDAIFIPDTVSAVGQIAPMLDYNDVKGVYLLGTKIWNTRSIIRRTGKHASSSIFVDAPLYTDNPLYKKFSISYKSRFEENPSIFSIQAFDAAKMFRHYIEDGTSSRVRLRENLSLTQKFPGVMGELNMSKDREVFRPITTMTVKEGRIQPL